MGDASTINKVHATGNSSSNAPFSRRRSSIRALYIHLDEATSLFPFSRIPRTCFAVDQTTSDLPSARHAQRSDQKEVRTHCRKRAPTTTTDHGPCPHLRNNLRVFKCEMIDVLLGKLGGCLTPNTRMIPFLVVIDNGLAYQLIQILERLCFSKHLTPFC